MTTSRTCACGTSFELEKKRGRPHTKCEKCRADKIEKIKSAYTPEKPPKAKRTRADQDHDGITRLPVPPEDEPHIAVLMSDRFAVPRWQAEILVRACREGKTLSNARGIARNDGCPLGGPFDIAINYTLGEMGHGKETAARNA